MIYPVHVKQSEGQATQVDPLKYYPLEHELQSENEGPVQVKQLEWQAVEKYRVYPD